MASFRTHISFGIALGAASMFALASLALAPLEWGFYIMVGLAVSVGALLPDIDSDSGLPFHVTFGSLALIAGGLALLGTLTYLPGNYLAMVIWPVAAIFIVWVPVGTLFKRFTKHRGMAHSIPAAALAGMVLFSLAHAVGFANWEAFLLGLALALGYILHLLLDEVNSAVNFHGQLFVPNKAFGSALKFISHNDKANTLVYVPLILLVAGNWQSLYDCFVQFIHII